MFGQLQVGLNYQIVKSPAVSGSQSYKALCTAAKAEGKHIAELRRRQLYYNDLANNHKTDGSLSKKCQHHRICVHLTLHHESVMCVVVHSI